MVQFPDIVRQLIETGKVRWRYRDFPLNMHPFAWMAAHSAACADDQGRYWEQHAAIYQGTGQWSRESEPSGTFREYAKTVGLDVKAYDACMMSAKFAGRIKASYDEGVSAGVSGTPDLLHRRPPLQRRARPPTPSSGSSIRSTPAPAATP